ncbi:MAG: hypothetical protein DWQ07_17815 [Chloroflexi bacterium]|nr:MAG: hypothetical protein DWQ07_17815 [Chloroflexota bacterium]
MFAEIQSITSTSKIILQERVMLYSFILLLPLIAALLYLIPVFSIPGNDIAFQLQLFTAPDFLLLFVVAGLESLLLVMMLYLYRQRHLRTINRGNLGVLSGIPVFLFGANFCPMCLAGLLGIFGPGVVAFAVQYRVWAFSVSISLLLLSLYSTSKKVQGVCENCV